MEDKKKPIVLTLSPEEAFDRQNLQRFILKKLGISSHEKVNFQLTRRSIDARSKNIRVHLSGHLNYGEIPRQNISVPDYPDVTNADPVIIVGAGPAGLFAALRLIELGKKPVVVERGKDVRARRRDLAAINKEHVVNPESNYCFGEGGAGTYSDGKLYTRSKKRGVVQDILKTFVAHGAAEEILFDTHPHIGTNKLPKIVAALRATILAAGGEVHFNCRVTDFLISNNRILGVMTANGEQLTGTSVILATGHSASDIFQLLHDRGIQLEAKPFAIGVRVEHEQELIDQIQYGVKQRGLLPAATYALTYQMGHTEKKRGVFSFCMCPGGFIVPAATAPGELVVNGMSPSRRDSRFANSGIVVGIDHSDLAAYQAHGVLAGLYYRQDLERSACQMAGGGQLAPAQRLMDFMEKKRSSDLRPTSYQPGLASVEMDAVLPEMISTSLRAGFQYFGRKMKGYLTNEAQIIGLESRTSSPVRIPRDPVTLAHVQISNLFPCGEGAGYAGGIVSAAIDGVRCAEAASKIKKAVS